MLGDRYLGRLLRTLGALALLAVAACAPSAPGAPTTSPGAKLEALNQLPAAERRAKLVDEARKEGTVVWYSPTIGVEMEPFIASFNQLYPDVKVQYVRSNSDELLEKLLSEYRAGKHLADVIMMGLEGFEDLKSVNGVEPYCSPERQAIADDFKEPACWWTVRHHNPQVIGYNTSRIPADQAPKTWSDLLDPRWKGRMGLPAEEGPELIVLLEQIMGKERGQEYVRKLADQQIQLHRGHTALAQLIAAGDVDLGFKINIPAITNTQKVGGPIASYSPDPLPTSPSGIMLAGSAQHPFAAALVIDYALSREGQQRMTEISTRFGARTDMAYPDQHLLEGSKLLVIGPELIRGEGYKQATRQFKELFMQR